MSKGLGRIERQVIELFDKQSRLKGSEVVTAIAGTTSTPSEKFAIRRALASLQGKGFLDKTSGPDGPRWGGPNLARPMLIRWCLQFTSARNDCWLLLAPRWCLGNARRNWPRVWRRYDRR